MRGQYRRQDIALVTVTRRVGLPGRFAREETGPFNRGGAGESLITPSAPHLRDNRHRCHVGFALGKVFAVKSTGVIFDRRGALGRDRIAARTTKGFSTAGFEGMWPRRYLVLSLGWPDGKGKGEKLYFWALW